MSTPLKNFAFVDATIAAEILHVTQDTVVDWVAGGRLRAYGGRANNPFLRSSDVAALAAELGIKESDSPKRTKSASARVQARLTADSRWSDVSEDEIRSWAQRADADRLKAARTTAKQAISRLEALSRVIDDLSR